MTIATQERLTYISVGIELAARQTEALFLSPDEELEIQPVTLRITKRDFLAWEWVLLRYSESLPKNFEEILLFNLQQSLTEEMWNQFTDDRIFTLRELAKITEVKPPPEPFNIGKFLSIDKEEVKLRTNAETAN